MDFREIGRRVRELTGATSRARPLPTQPRGAATIWDDHYGRVPDYDYAEGERRILANDGPYAGHSMTLRKDPSMNDAPTRRDHLTDAEAVYLQGVNRLRENLQAAKDSEACYMAENAALAARVEVLTEMLRDKTADCDRWQMLATELTVNLTTAGNIINDVLNKAHQEAQKIRPDQVATIENVDREIERRRDQPPSAVPAAALDGQSEPDDGRPPPAFLTEDKHG